MNGIILTILSAISFGGIEFGWSQLPDGRVEYIIQLDDQAIAALKNGRSLTSSLPPEVQNADRIRIQYGAGPVEKGLLLQKPQIMGSQPSQTIGAQTIGAQGLSTVANHGGVGPASNQVRSRFEPPQVADTRPSLIPQELSNRGISTGQVRYSNGNNSVVFNSSLPSVQKTSYVVPQEKAESRLPWGNDGRTIRNFDDQPGFQNRTPATELGNTAKSISGFPPNNSVPGNPALANNSPAGFNPVTAGTGFNAATANPKNGAIMSPVSPSAPVNNGRNWTTQFNQNRLANIPASNSNGLRRDGSPNNGLNQQSPGIATSTRSPAFTNPVTTAAAVGGNRGLPAHTFPNAVQPGVNGNPASLPQPAGYAYPKSPISTHLIAPPNPEVAALTKQLEKLKADVKAKQQDEQLQEMQSSYEKKIEDLKQQLTRPEDEAGDGSSSSTVSLVEGVSQDPSKDGNSVAMTIFLLFSIGLNVFLVVQYLSVQNQFRDLSNDLRDSFMSNNYE
jgi:hypothetical protein